MQVQRGVGVRGKANNKRDHEPVMVHDSDAARYKTLNVEVNDFAGLEITVPDRKKRLSAADWLCAASIAHKKKYLTQLDHDGRDLDFYKAMRRDACRNFFSSALAGLLLGIWANEVIHAHGRNNSFQSLSLQVTMVCSSGLAVYFLCDFYYAELSVARLKGWQLAPGFCPRALKGANLWNQFLRDLLILVPQPLPFMFFTFTVHDAGLGKDSTYPVSVVLLSLMFLRIYFIPRFHSHCIEDLHTHRHDVFFSLNKTLLEDSFLLKSTMTVSFVCVCPFLLCLPLLKKEFTHTDSHKHTRIRIRLGEHICAARARTHTEREIVLTVCRIEVSTRTDAFANHADVAVGRGRDVRHADHSVQLHAHDV